MKNYQRCIYSNYQVMFPNRECTRVTRKECFAAPTPPTAANPYPQRWYYDPESGLVVRLPRNKMGNDLAKQNAADLKAEERQRERYDGCAARRGEVRCPVTCSRCPMKENCVSKHKAANGAKCRKKCEVCFQPCVSRCLERMRKPIYGSNSYVADQSPAIAEEKALLKALFSALDRLTPDARVLWDCLITETKKQDIADRFHITIDGVRYREQKLFARIRADKTLQSFFIKI